MGLNIGWISIPLRSPSPSSI